MDAGSISAKTIGRYAIVMLMAGVIWFLPWDFRPLYISYILILGTIWVFFKRIKSEYFLLFFFLLSFLIGIWLNQFPSGFTTDALLSGVEFVNLSLFALLLLLVGYVSLLLQKWNSRRLIQSLIVLFMAVYICTNWGLSWKESLPQPLGPYAVGTMSYDFQSVQGEPFTQDPSDQRRLMLQFYYPGIHQPEAERLTFKGLKRVQSHSFLNVPLIDSTDLPLILYSAGAGGSRFDNLSQFERLASQGYIIVSIDHSYLNDVVFSDGMRIKAGTMDSLGHFDPFEQYLEAVVHGIRVKDLQLVLDEIFVQQRDSSAFLYQKIDTTKIGVMGWSIGGSAAVELSTIDPRISAGINIDGWGWMNMDSVGSTLNRPFMYIHSDIDDVDPWDLWGTSFELSTVQERDRRQSMREKKLFEQAPNAGYSLIIRQASHSNLRIHGILNLSRLGSIDPWECDLLLSEIMFRFFEQHLNHQKEDPLVDWLQDQAQIQLNLFHSTKD